MRVCVTGFSASNRLGGRSLLMFVQTLQPHSRLDPLAQRFRRRSPLLFFSPAGLPTDCVEAYIEKIVRGEREREYLQMTWIQRIRDSTSRLLDGGHAIQHHSRNC